MQKLLFKGVVISLDGPGLLAKNHNNAPFVAYSECTGICP